MRINDLLPPELADGLEINVYGWRWPAADGDRPSRIVWQLAKSESDRLQRSEAGVGVFRLRLGPDGDWFVWIVDVATDLFARSDVLHQMPGERVEPEEEVAFMLVARHLRWVTESPTGRRVRQQGHYGSGARLNKDGSATVDVRGGPLS